MVDIIRGCRKIKSPMWKERLLNMYVNQILRKQKSV